LLPEFRISTKIGFFPGEGQRAAHHLTPELLRYGAELAVDDLGTVPAVMLLHNPEASLSVLAASEAYDRFSAACAVLAEAKSAGLCGEWGISSWNPAPVLAALAVGKSIAVPRPDVVMVRAGMLVSADALDCAEELFEVLNVPFTGRWGMSPFGGYGHDPIWNEVNARTILGGNPLCSQHQAAFRLAYELPAVQRVAVGTTNPIHLRDLIMATTLHVDRERLSSYRTLLREYAQKGRESALEIG
jgi:aryl-alcohol dehydrogenase-like predicted oxidoreductase